MPPRRVALFIDLNTLVSNRWDAIGEQRTAPYFNDSQHTTKIGARVHAESVVDGLRRLGAITPLANALASR